MKPDVRVFPGDDERPEIRVYGPTRTAFRDPETDEWHDTWLWQAEATIRGVVHSQVVTTAPDIGENWIEPVRKAARYALLGQIKEKRMSQPKRWVSPDDIDNWVAHHPPANEVVIAAHQRVREVTRTYLNALNDVLPEGPRKTTALNTALEAMWAANSQIACVGNTDGIWQAAVQEVLYPHPEIADVEDQLYAAGERLARQFHETYERLAPQYGYKTRAASAVPWDDVPEENKAVMCATARELVTRGAIEAAGLEDDELRAELLRRSGADRIILYADTEAARRLAMEDGNYDRDGNPVKTIYTGTDIPPWGPDAAQVRIEEARGADATPMAENAPGDNA